MMQEGSFMTLLLKELRSTGTEQEPGENMIGILAWHCHWKEGTFIQTENCDDKEETALQ
jgi:hypothetical protein